MKIRKQKFLAAYPKIGTVTQTCKETGIARRTFHGWCKQDKRFLAQYEVAQEEATESLELEARRRAAEGTVEPVYQQGKKVGSIRRYSDTLLIFLLKAAKPEKYRDSYDGGGGRTPHADREQTLEEIQRKLARLAPPAPAPEVLPKPDR